MNWDLYRYFIEIYRTGSLKAAAGRLGVNQTTVGRNLTALEQDVGTRLFERRSDGFVLTSAGARILQAVQSTEDTLLAVERLLSGKDERIEGSVRIAAPGALANHWLIPKLAPLLRRHSGLRIELLTGPEVVNLARREADVAIRLVRPQQTGLIVRKVATLKLALFAHRSLLKTHGVPKTIADLRSLPFIGLYPDATSDAELQLLKSFGGEPEVCIRSAAWSSAAAAVAAGLGVAILPTFMARSEARILSILPEKAATVPVWLVYHPDLRNAARVRVVLEFLTESLSELLAESP